MARPASKSMVSAGRPRMRLRSSCASMILRSLKPNLVAGRDDEALVRRVRRAHQNLLEPLRFLGPLRHKKSDLVETLLVEDDRAARAKELQLQAALAAPGAAADLDRARGAVGHSDERGRDVERFDLPPSARRPGGSGRACSSRRKLRVGPRTGSRSGSRGGRRNRPGRRSRTSPGCARKTAPRNRPCSPRPFRGENG